MVSTAAIAAARVRSVISQVIANTPPTIAVPANVDSARQPKGLSPNSAMPAAISALPSSGCSIFTGPDSASSVRAAGT